MGLAEFFLIPFLTADPAPSATRSKAAMRGFDCDRLTVEAASRLRPGEVPPARARGDYLERSALICRQRVLRDGVRHPGEEATLAGLEARVGELVRLAASVRSDLAGRTWLVEAFHASAPVSSKIAFAGKNALMRAGLSASDRAPELGAGDLDVLTRLPPMQAYPGACQRWWSTGSVGPSDALAAFVQLDARETALHVAVCADGVWTWLR